MHSCRVIFSSRPPGVSAYRLVDGDGKGIEEVNSFLDATAVRGLSQETVRTYAYASLSLWKWLLKASLSIEELTETHLADYIRQLHDEAPRTPAPRSINLRLLVARSLYRFHTGYDLPRAPRSPLVAIPLFAQPSRVGLCSTRRLARPSLRVKVPRRLVVPLARENIHRFFESLRHYRDLAIAALMLFCGLRSREVLALRLADLNVLEEEIRISGKGGKERVLPFTRYVRRAIASYLELERPRTDCDSLFVKLKGQGRGKPMTRAGLRDIFRYHSKRSGVEKANPHRFRHTFALDMVREGMPLPVLMRLMGHSTIEMTMRYVNLSAEDVREQFERAVRRLAEGTQGEGPLPRNP